MLTWVTPPFALLDFSYNKGAPPDVNKKFTHRCKWVCHRLRAPWPGHISLCDFVCVSDSLQDSAPQQYVRAATTARGRCDCQRNNHTWWDAIVVGVRFRQLGVSEHWILRAWYPIHPCSRMKIHSFSTVTLCLDDTRQQNGHRVTKLESTCNREQP